MGERSIFVDGRQTVLGGKVDDPLAVQDGQHVGDHQDGIGRGFGHLGEGGGEIVGGAHPERYDHHAQPLRLGLGRLIAQGHAQIVCVP